MVKRKMKQIENHFDSNVNMVNAERKEQKKAQAKLKELSEIQQANQI